MNMTAIFEPLFANIESQRIKIKINPWFGLIRFIDDRYNISLVDFGKVHVSSMNPCECGLERLMIWHLFAETIIQACNLKGFL